VDDIRLKAMLIDKLGDDLLQFGHGQNTS